MDCVTVLGPLWLLCLVLFGFLVVFFFKLFNLEEVQGRKVRRLALPLAERWLLNFL